MRSTLFLFLTVFLVNGLFAQSLYEMPEGVHSRLGSFENKNGIKGQGGQSNKTAKGHAFERMMPGEAKTMIDIPGSGIIQRIWLTVDQTPRRLRSLRLQCFWDQATKPAVDVPLGDFFGFNLGKPIAFESALFSSGEGRSFVCYVPMPFRKGARIQLTNEGMDTVMLFYDVDFVEQSISSSSLYFHAYWSRQKHSELGKDFIVLPKVLGKGRFLGMSVGLHTNPVYQTSWWGEGEIKMFMDGDSKYPTINGTGSEDYIGSAWGLGTFVNQYQGCTVANDSTGEFNFYRWHIPDAVYFEKDIQVHFQQMGGWMRDRVRELVKSGAPLIPVTVDDGKQFYRLLDMPNHPKLEDAAFPNGWVNFYRTDDYSAVAYFYLDKPESGLPPLAPVSVRTEDLEK